mmetsp:Transcript_8445/g.17187  ORF Transcript_8445/g.17187 Transcript_8445/m.17187 type:complete len:258 (-) Transcript_8445:577-1350(-)
MICLPRGSPVPSIMTTICAFHEAKVVSVPHRPVRIAICMALFRCSGWSALSQGILGQLENGLDMTPINAEPSMLAGRSMNNAPPDCSVLPLAVTQIFLNPWAKTSPTKFGNSQSKPNMRDMYTRRLEPNMLKIDRNNKIFGSICSLVMRVNIDMKVDLVSAAETMDGTSDRVDLGRLFHRCEDAAVAAGAAAVPAAAPTIPIGIVFCIEGGESDLSEETAGPGSCSSDGSLLFLRMLEASGVGQTSSGGGERGASGS